jgi:hydrogenase maturation protein HypF
MGRLFDAAAAILGVRRRSSYEGQAAMELEALARRFLAASGDSAGDPTTQIGEATVRGLLPRLELPVDRVPGEPAVIDPLPLLAELAERATAGGDVGLLAAAFHAAVGEVTIGLTEKSCVDHSIARVALGGGVFQNSLLLAIVGEGLVIRGLDVLLPERLGPNDGSISYGQAVVAAARLAAEQGR